MAAKPTRKATARKAAAKAKPKPAPAEQQRTGAATPRRAPGARSRPAPRRAPIAAALPLDLVEHFGDDVVGMVRAEMPPGATERDLYRLLTEARRLGADPARGDVYLATGKTRDGAASEYSVAAKVDPLLRFVERAPGYCGHDEAALFTEDEFQQGEATGTGGTLRERAGVRHVTGHPKDRGELWGAWCAVEIEGRPPTVRVLAAADFLPEPAAREALEPDDPRRRHPDLCMIAAAMSNALRRAVGLNDVIGAAELPQPGARVPAPAPAATAAEGDRMRDPLDDLDRSLLAEFRRATGFAPGLWPRAKVRVRLLACEDDDARRALIAEVHATTSDAIQRRLDELARFERQDLDEDALREYDREVATLTDALGKQETTRAAA